MIDEGCRVGAKIGRDRDDIEAVRHIHTAASRTATAIMRAPLVRRNPLGIGQRRLLISKTLLLTKDADTERPELITARRYAQR